MESLTFNVEIHLPHSLYLKNPKDSLLGKRLVEESAALIAEQGIESFNFKRLSLACACTEATVYRYFENKHKILLYILNIYWGWQEYRLVLHTQNLSKSSEKLKKALEVLAHPEIPGNYSKIFGQHIIKTAIYEGVKIHLNREIKSEIKDGSLACYLRLVQRLGKFINEKEPNYDYSEALASTIIDNALQLQFYMQNSPEISGKIKNVNVLKSFLKTLLPAS